MRKASRRRCNGERGLRTEARGLEQGEECTCSIANTVSSNIQRKKLLLDYIVQVRCTGPGCRILSTKRTYCNNKLSPLRNLRVQRGGSFEFQTVTDKSMKASVTIVCSFPSMEVEHGDEAVQSAERITHMYSVDSRRRKR